MFGLGLIQCWISVNSVLAFCIRSVSTDTNPRISVSVFHYWKWKNWIGASVVVNQTKIVWLTFRILLIKLYKILYKTHKCSQLPTYIVPAWICICTLCFCAGMCVWWWFILVYGPMLLSSPLFQGKDGSLDSHHKHNGKENLAERLGI